MATNRVWKWGAALAAAGLCGVLQGAPALPAPKPVTVAAASKEAELAIKGFQVAKGLRVDLFAAEPHLANPVAFHIDELGRFFVVESFRLHRGITDIRGHMNWLDAELASQSVDDLRALYKKHQVKGLNDYSDRVRLVEDRDGDGRADHATVFADGFNDDVDGLAAGVLAHRGKVWLTNIPNLWLLQDKDGDGVAESRQSLAQGFGVRVGFLGHDLHGLRMGPDGKLYFSNGDRAASVVTKEGRRLHTPETGAIYRCNPDGTELELFHVGLRNPQELAFDQFGNLFTGDNNSDGGDPARWVYAVEGGDSGWRIGWQFIEEKPWTRRRGPWLDERMCFPDGVAAHRLPPLANIGSGPSGLTYNPGLGLGAEYADTFFMCDFRGSAGGSGVHTIRMAANGASFKVEKTGQLIWRVLVTDAEFGPDGNLYISDWVEGWGLPNKGRIYRVSNPAPEPAAAKAATETKGLLAAGFEKSTVPELARLLGHTDQRVRMDAQFELVARNAMQPLLDVAARADAPRLARLHAVWGLGQLGRAVPEINTRLLPLLQDADAEVRAQAAKVLGDTRHAPARQALIGATADASPRVQAFAAISLGKLGGAAHVEAIVEMLRKNADQDAVLRHAGVMALAGVGDAKTLTGLAQHASPAVRLGALLALRRMEHPGVAQFLADENPGNLTEAARAIADDLIPDAVPALAKLSVQPGLSKPVMRRVLAANYRIGNAAALAAVAADTRADKLARAEALSLLGEWANPSGRDKVSGLWRPIPERDGTAALAAVEPVLESILKDSPAEVRAEAVTAADRLSAKAAAPALFAFITDAKASASARAEALKVLGRWNDARLPQAVAFAAKAPEEVLRKEATRLAAQVKPADAAAHLAAVLDKGSMGEKQAALMALGDLKDAAADTILGQWLDTLSAGKAPAELQLELLEASAKRSAVAVQGRLKKFHAARPDATKLPFEPAAFAETMAGGDAISGRKLFFENQTLNCARCHRAGGQGGDVGPVLDGMAAKPRAEILESLVNPNAKITPGFETVLVTTKNGGNHAGIVKSETAADLVLLSAEDGLVKVSKANIQIRKKGLSSMPAGLHLIITRRELRDVVAFLSTLQPVKVPEKKPQP